jgi:hypothetical protein
LWPEQRLKGGRPLMQIASGGGGAGARRLVRLFRALAPSDREALIAFAEFLASRAQGQSRGEAPAAEPEPIPRPAEESVVAAIKRLSRSYHMLDRTALLTETSALMAAHVLNGREAQAVIDELEALFAGHYAHYREAKGR